MANASSSSNPSEGIQKLNDSVWELKRPQADHEVDIIFFHGLQLSKADLEAAHRNTWLSRDGQVVWPKEWLGATFPTARIWSISYNSLADRDGEMRVKQISENLLQDIVTHVDHGAGQSCPVILVGHSLGGIIMKSLILECIDRESFLELSISGSKQTRTLNRISNFLGNCRGMFFYSSPLGGSWLADFLGRFPGKDPPVVRLLKIFNAETNDINENLRQIRQGTRLNIQTFAICENQDTYFMGLEQRVVTEASAKRDVDGYYTAQEADHIRVCKPQTQTDGIYARLTYFIRSTCMEENLTHRTPQALQELEQML